MLVLYVEVWPGGDPGQRRRIAQIGAAQTSVVSGIADYEAVLIVDEEPVGVAKIRRHLRADGPLELIRRLIDEATDNLDAIDPDTREVILELLEWGS